MINLSENRKDPYELLGVSKNASADDIKRAFRRKAKQYHPDLQPEEKKTNAEEKFRKINEAYEILSDPNKRERFDRFGWAGVDSNVGFESGSGFDFDDMFGFGDIFSSFFGGSSRRRGGRRRARRVGSNIEQVLNLEFEEAVFGIEKDIKVKRRVPCGECGGSGAEPGSSPDTCPNCRGSGQVVQSTRTAFGIMQQIGVCSNCNGKG